LLLLPELGDFAAAWRAAAATGPMRVTPAELVLDAIRQGGRVIVSTYNEPLITSEWALRFIKEARGLDW